MIFCDCNAYASGIISLKCNRRTNIYTTDKAADVWSLKQENREVWRAVQRLNNWQG